VSCVCHSKQLLFSLNSLNRLVFIVETWRFSCEVRTEFLYIIQNKFSLQSVKLHIGTDPISDWGNRIEQPVQTTRRRELSVNRLKNLARRLEGKGLPQCGNVTVVAEGLLQTTFRKHMNCGANCNRFSLRACVGEKRMSVSDKSTRPSKTNYRNCQNTRTYLR
jgi:hypothetical protein